MTISQSSYESRQSLADVVRIVDSRGRKDNGVIAILDRGASTSVTGTLAAILRGDRRCPVTSASDLTELLAGSAAEGLTGLLHVRLSQATEADGWPRSVIEDLVQVARVEDARELLRQREIASVLVALSDAGVRPILLKGAPLAYSLYPTPASRPRIDCDVMVRHEDIPAVRVEMASRGYVAPLGCEGELLVRQFTMARRDAFGVDHQFDFHWKISSQSLFADLLTYEELAAEVIQVEALGPFARAAGPVHALLLACLHPVIHHRNRERLIWTYDVHLLASRLSANDFERFAGLIVEKKVAAIAAHALSLSQLRFATRVPERVTVGLAGATAEPSASYLRPGRRWHHELLSNVNALPSWRDRSRLLREVIFPDRRYMLEAYGVKSRALGLIVVPALYFHRGTSGLLKILIGRK
jgi:hypothetical protein